MINVAVIGTGSIGPVHIEALRRIRDCREILDDDSIHVIHTCAPNSLHFPMNI